MRILACIAFSVVALLGPAAGLRAGQSSVSSSPEAAGAIMGRVTIDNQGAPGIGIALVTSPYL
jgi:hypothetical protein